MKSETLARNVTIPKRSGSEKVENGFSKWGQQIKAGLVNWSKKINSKTHFEAIITHPLGIRCHSNNDTLNYGYLVVATSTSVAFYPARSATRFQ